MLSTFDVIEATLGSAVADAGTFTVPYPTGREADDYIGVAPDHKLVSNLLGTLKSRAGQISLAFGATLITVTNKSGTTLPAGTKVYLQVDRPGYDAGGVAPLADNSMVRREIVEVNLGTPITADPNGIVESQDLTSAGVFSVSATAAAAIAAAALAGVLDVPRNIVAAWTGTAVITITGTDALGNVIVESSGSGTSLAGKKAFKTVTDVSVSANVTSLTVGTGDVLGLPVFIPTTGAVLQEREDGAVPTGGTVVAGVLTTPTATTGDVRGTYDPDSACDGSAAFSLLLVLPDPTYLGKTNFAG